MNKLQYKKGLLYTSIEIKFKEKSIVIEDVIIDTGASHTIITTEYLEEMDIPLLDDDELIKAIGYGGMTCYSIRKRLDEIRCGNLVLKDIKLDFGVIDPKDRINGLIGLDFMIGAKTIINLVDFTLYEKEL
ncbi:retropepsin-like aspartic protease [Tissierella praeacuta]|uniref:retropepsin-like aspartic protease n=1 Tax=Tissierella praeacuta TaxID=43131 RepID=UPI00333F7884